MEKPSNCSIAQGQQSTCKTKWACNNSKWLKSQTEKRERTTTSKEKIQNKDKTNVKILSTKWWYLAGHQYSNVLKYVFNSE